MKTPAVPSGVVMMLRAMGVDFNPDEIAAAIKDVPAAVIEIRDRLKRIEDKLDKVLSLSGNVTADNSEMRGVPAKALALPEHSTKEKNGSHAPNRS